MKHNLTRKDVTQEVIQAGYAYLAAKAATQVITETVRPIHVKVFAGFEFYNDLSVEHGAKRERITDPDALYLSLDETGVNAYYAAVDQALRVAGLKPTDMPVEHCPILVAEHEQTKAERVLIEAAARMLGYHNPQDFNNLLLCQEHGLERRNDFIELVVKLVVNL